MSKKKKKVLVVPKQPRNPLALNPLLHKGGAHGKSNKAARLEAKRLLRVQTRSSDQTVRGELAA